MEEIKTNNIEARDSTENNRIFLTPGQLVMRRFIRNRAAVIGIVVLVFMVVFCFIGPLFLPYTETELFYMA